MTDLVTAALATLAGAGIAPDLQELLMRGNPDLGVKWGALGAIVNDAYAAGFAAGRIRELLDGRQAAQIAAMNAVSLHQTDRLLPVTTLGGRPWKQRLHPLTCGNDSKHTLLFPFCEDGKVKLICRDCDYTQDNAAMHSVDVAP